MQWFIGGKSLLHDLIERSRQKRQLAHNQIKAFYTFCHKHLELFDKDSTAKEKGRISVKFQDKDTNFSQRSEQPCQVHQN